MAKTWQEIRAVRYSPMTPPPEWPAGVRPISIDGVSLFGINPETNKLYWDGKEVVVRDRVRLGSLELILAVLVAIGTFGAFVVELGNALNWFPRIRWPLSFHAGRRQCASTAGNVSALRRRSFGRSVRPSFKVLAVAEMSHLTTSA